jgi:Zn-dependent peptidase ImmA (M78 family)
MVQMCDLTVDQLLIHANELSQKHWGVDYTGAIELTNRHWKNFNGKYICTMLDFKNPPARHKIIAMSKKRNAERTDAEVLGTLLHELVHWRLHTTGVPYRDSNPEFIKECLRVGAPISQSSSAQWAYKQYMQSYT